MTREECLEKLNGFEHDCLVDNVILFVPSKLHTIVFEECSGSQLTHEDYAEGIDAYIMATVINLDCGEDDIGAIVDDGEQYPFFYSTDEVSDEFILIYDWLESFYNEVPEIVVLRV